MSQFLKNENLDPEKVMKRFYTDGLAKGKGTVFTPKEIRDKLTIHAKEGMKILVMFNWEICVDLKKKNLTNVTFCSDDEGRNELVKKMGYQAELVDPRSINKKFEGMKFDLIISNPPYKGLDLNILENVLDLGEKVTIVHPATWCLDRKDKKSIYIRLKRKLTNRVSHLELLHGNNIFGVRFKVPIVITTCENSSTIQVIDNSKMFADHDVAYFAVVN